jgi:hypothetical protein
VAPSPQPVKPSWAWQRLIVVAALFALAVAEALLDWRRHPPNTRPDGGLFNMRNGPGDLSLVLRLYAVEFLVAMAALQPWRPRPRRRWLGLAALAFAMFGVLRWLVGLHSPTVMFGHDALVLVIALVLGASVLVFNPGTLDSPVRAPVT